MTGWTAMLDGAQPKAGTYLVCNRATKQVLTARFAPRKDEWKFASAAQSFTVTHWRPLPESA